MELIIHEVMEKISSSYEKELIELLKERKDISEFILIQKSH